MLDFLIGTYELLMIIVLIAVAYMGFMLVEGYDPDKYQDEWQLFVESRAVLILREVSHQLSAVLVLLGN